MCVTITKWFSFCFLTQGVLECFLGPALEHGLHCQVVNQDEPPDKGSNLTVNTFAVNPQIEAGPDK